MGIKIYTCSFCSEQSSPLDDLTLPDKVFCFFFFFVFVHRDIIRLVLHVNGTVMASLSSRTTHRLLSNGVKDESVCVYVCVRERVFVGVG